MCKDDQHDERAAPIRQRQPIFRMAQAGEKDADARSEVGAPPVGARSAAYDLVCEPRSDEGDAADAPLSPDRGPGCRVGQEGSATLLALILLTTLLAVGAAVALSARVSSIASRQREHMVEADRAADAAVELLNRNLWTWTRSDELREQIEASFSLPAESSSEAILRALEGLPIGFSLRQREVDLIGTARWRLERRSGGDPRVYAASYTLTSSGRRSTGDTSTLEFTGAVLLSVGHMPLSHYEVVSPDGLPFKQDSFGGPVRVEEDLVLNPPVIFHRVLETASQVVQGIEGCKVSAGIRTGLPPLTATDSILGEGIEDIGWDRLRLHLRLESIDLPPPPGIYFDDGRGVFIEGDVDEMTLATRGDEQLVRMRHAILGVIQLRMVPTLSVVTFADGREETVLGGRDRLVVHGRIGSLGGGRRAEDGQIEQTSDVIGDRAPSIIRPMTIAASSAIEISNHLVANVAEDGTSVMIGLISTRIAGSGTPGFIIRSPVKAILVDAHLYLVGGSLTAEGTRATVRSVQMMRDCSVSSDPILVRYDESAEGGAESPPGYPVTQEVTAYVGQPIARSLRPVREER